MYCRFECQMFVYMQGVTYFIRNLENLILKKVAGINMNK